ncbi:WD repeat-containing protein 82 [Orchesella cincta]|uniref:WD repeat-containing protein 82 n=1 Tax=Orchesella cincta TaxID=48709 RepID=A0A1D2MXZ9_ORCCI|nr:WD repeat-containing protein 82 [Orchesella cincta]
MDTGLIGLLGQAPPSTSNGEDVTVQDEIEFSDSVVCGLRVAKVFRENTDTINSIDFNAGGDMMISAGDDDQIIIYDCENGTIKRNLKSKKYGVSMVRFTHSRNTVIHGSTKIDDTIRYLSLYDNKYIRYFSGHTNKVTSLCMSATDDRFLSASLDRTLKLWDLRTPVCQGMMYLQGKPIAAFDPEGLIFAAGMNNECIKLYDLRSFDKGPFCNFRLSHEKNEWASVKFSPNGKQILLTITGSSVIRVIDAFYGTPLHSLTDHKLTSPTYSPEACYSPDSKYIFLGSEDGKIHVWNVESGRKVVILNGDHPRPLTCVQFNPKYMMMATACTDMSFWLPRPQTS